MFYENILKRKSYFIRHIFHDMPDKKKEQLSKACSDGNHSKCEIKPHTTCNCECHKQDQQKERRIKSAYSAMSNASVSSWTTSLPFTGF